MSDGHTLCETCELGVLSVPEETTRQTVEGDDCEVCPDCGRIMKNYTAEANSETVTTVGVGGSR